MRVAYEALAWGRHVNTYERSWEVVRRADHPALGLCLDSFHILSRGADPAGIDDIPGREAVLPAAGRRPAHGHGRAAVEPPPPALPRPGRLRPARLPRPRAGRRLHRAAVARGVQRRVPPVRPAPRRRGRPALAARAARRRPRRTSRRPSRRAPSRRPRPELHGLRVRRARRRRRLRARGRAGRSPRSGSPTPAQHRTKPVQLWEQGAGPGAAQRPADRPTAAGRRGRARRRERPTPARPRAARPGTARPGRCPSTRGPAEADLLGVAAPDGTAVFFCRTGPEGGLAGRLPARPTRPAPGDAGSIAHRPRRAHPALRQLRRGGAVLPRACSACRPSTRRRSRRRSAWCATAPSPTAARTVRLGAERVRAAPRRLGARRRRTPSTSRSPAPTCSRSPAAPARGGRAAARRSRTTTTTTSTPGSPRRRASPSCDARARRAATTATGTASSCHFYTEVLGGRVFFEVVQRIGGYDGLRRGQRPDPDGRAPRARLVSPEPPG